MEFFKIIPLLTLPRLEHDFVFEAIAPLLLGFGFSSAATIPDPSSIQMSVVHKNLMLRLDHDKYYIQVDSTEKALNFSSFFPWAKSKKKSSGFSLLARTGYYHIQTTKLDTFEIGLNDSPADLAVYIIDKFPSATNPSYKYRNDGEFLEKYTYDELIDNLMMYWVSNSITTAMRIYAEMYTKSNRSLLPRLESSIHLLSQTTDKGSQCFTQFSYEIMEQTSDQLRTRFVNLLRVIKSSR